MYRLFFDESSLDKIKKLLYSPLESSIDQTELEIRLQSINQDGKILPYINEKLFDSIRRNCEQKSNEILTSHTVITTKGDLREIFDVNGNTYIYQQKQRGKIADIEVVTSITPFKDDKYNSHNLRISKAYELPSSQQIFKNSLEREFKRNRNRISYSFPDYVVDTTIVVDSSGRNMYEVEVEFKNIQSYILQKQGDGDIGFKSFVGKLKECFSLFYPQFHSIYDVAFYTKNIMIKNQNIPIPYESRPVNIQEKIHVNQKLLRYAVTNKLDGIGYYLYIREDGRIILLNNTDAWMVVKVGALKGSQILKCEVLMNNENISIFFYDVIYDNQIQDIYKKPLKVRIEQGKTFINNYLKIFPPWVKLGFKEYEYNEEESSEGLIKSILTVVKNMVSSFGIENVDKMNDGIIFEPNTYSSGVDRLPILKWKFPSKVTIDFYLTKNSSNGTKCIFTCMVNKWFNNIPKLVPFKINGKDATIQFDNCDYDKKIAELGWDIGTNSFVFHRLREDKTDPNAEKVAYDTYNDMVNIFTLPSLLDKIKKDIKEKEPTVLSSSLPQKKEGLKGNLGSLIKTEGPYRRDAKKIKGQLISEWCKNKNTVLDLGSGKGGDYHRYDEAGIKQIFAVEPNPSYRQESKSREQLLRSKSSQIRILSIGATAQDTNKIIQATRGEKVDVVSAMLSLTYSFKSETYLNKLVETIVATTKPNSVFIGTVVNGEKLSNMLIENGGEYSNSFATIKMLPPEQLFPYGQTIYTDLKGTETAENLHEYLFYINILSEKLEPYGYFLTRWEPFKASSEQSQNERMVFETYSSFVYERGTLINKNPLLGIQGGGFLYRMPTVADGSCLFHAVSAGLLGPYYTPKDGIRLREKVASSFNLYYYEKIYSGGFSIMRLEDALMADNERIMKQIIECSGSDDISKWLFYLLREYSNEYKDEISLSSFIDILPINEETKELLLGLHLLEFEKVKKSLANCSEWADAWAYDLLQRMLGINILYWSEVGKGFYREQPFYSYPDTILIYSSTDTHFENIRFYGNDRSVVSTEQAIEIYNKFKQQK